MTQKVGRIRVRNINELLESDSSNEPFADKQFAQQAFVPLVITLSETTPPLTPTKEPTTTDLKAEQLSSSKKKLFDAVTTPKRTSRANKKQPLPGQKRIDSFFKSCAKSYPLPVPAKMSTKKSKGVKQRLFDCSDDGSYEPSSDLSDSDEVFASRISRRQLRHSGRRQAITNDVEVVDLVSSEDEQANDTVIDNNNTLTASTAAAACDGKKTNSMNVLAASDAESDVAIVDENKENLLSTKTAEIRNGKSGKSLLDKKATAAAAVVLETNKVSSSSSSKKTEDTVVMNNPRQTRGAASKTAQQVTKKCLDLAAAEAESSVRQTRRASSSKKSAESAVSVDAPESTRQTRAAANKTKQSDSETLQQQTTRQTRRSSSSRKVAEIASNSTKQNTSKHTVTTTNADSNTRSQNKAAQNENPRKSNKRKSSEMLASASNKKSKNAKNKNISTDQQQNTVNDDDDDDSDLADIFELPKRKQCINQKLQTKVQAWQHYNESTQQQQAAVSNTTKVISPVQSTDLDFYDNASMLSCSLAKTDLNVIEINDDDDDDDNVASTSKGTAKSKRAKKGKSSRKHSAQKKAKIVAESNVRMRKPKPLPPYKIVEGTSFAVDAFQFGQIEGVTHYFLTHFHADHYVGLNRKFAMPLYLSEITARLLQVFIPVDAQFVHVLQLNEPQMIADIEVTAIDANHCPGAIMLLFKFSSGKCILHTGDFRACADMESEPVFWNNDIDTIYLDTTYLSKNYAFCTQAESIDQAITLLENFKLKHETKRILYVCGSYVIGKEKFWMALAKYFELKVWAQANRRKAFDAMQSPEMQELLCDDPLQAQIHVICMMKMRYESLVEYFASYAQHYDLLLALRPSGWEKNSKPQYRGTINLVGIEYSEHSSYAELKRFVQFLKPKQVISTVPAYSGDLSITRSVPTKWYQYDKLTGLNKNFQTSITTYLTRERANVEKIMDSQPYDYQFRVSPICSQPEILHISETSDESLTTDIIVPAATTTTKFNKIIEPSPQLFSEQTTSLSANGQLLEQQLLNTDSLTRFFLAVENQQPEEDWMS